MPKEEVKLRKEENNFQHRNKGGKVIFFKKIYRSHILKGEER
jgi:hypothetical protein